MSSLLASRSWASVEAGWESGDRLPVFRSAADRIEMPAAIRSGELDLVALLDTIGNELAYKPAAAGEEIAIRGLSRLAPDPRSPLWLEYREPGVFAIVAEQPPESLADEEFVTDRGVRVVLAGGEDAGLLAGHASSHAGLREFQLAVRAARLGTHVGFDQLMCLPLVREMELLDHQIRTAKTVLRRFRGRALLCDEVGLGKTIEAGLVLSELDLRGLARSVLVLVPPSLIEQWQGELRRKFSLDFVTHDDPKFRERGTAAWSEFDRVIVSTHTAKREPHRSAILARHWDLVIVDEAHHLRNRTTQLWKFASELRKQFMLLLTATPVQNNLDELFNLVTLLEPGLLSTAKQFQRQYVDRRDKLTPRNVDQLHELLAEVMVRNRRSTVGLQFTRRWAKTMSVPLTPDEAGLYRRVTDFVRQHLRAADHRGGLSRMALLSLQMALGSSATAAAGTLETMAGNPRLAEDLGGQLQALSAEARALTVNSKLQRLLEVLGEFPDKLVVFTQFRATQAMLAGQLAAA
ncbi:MAG: SNF2-related protein, partial [Pirellulaceae bacterium]|nr:SNF2-related protein [Pirellulaceae bacterium]